MTWDDIHDARNAFLSCMQATCAPGQPVPVRGAGISGDHLLDGAAALLLALADDRVSIAALGATATGVAAAVANVTGARLASVADADFVLVGGDAEPGAVVGGRQGTAREPHRAATLVYAGTWSPISIELSGPGVSEPRVADVAIPRDDAIAMNQPSRRAPGGVDVLVMTRRGVVAIPRSSTMTLLDR